MEIRTHDDPQLPARVEPAESPASLAKRFEELRPVAISSYHDLAKLINTGPSTYLFVLGTIVVVLGLAMKIEIGGEGIARLSPGEFVAVLVLGLLVLLAGAALLLLQYQGVKGVQEQLFKASAIEGAADPPEPDAPSSAENGSH